MATWVEDIIQALLNLGGQAPYRQIYDEVKRIRHDPLPPSWQNVIQRIIETHSSDSKNFSGKDFFRKVDKGVWALREHNGITRQAKPIIDHKTDYIKYPIVNLEYEDSASKLRTIKQYREYREPNTEIWEQFIDEFFQILGFSTEEIIPGIKFLKKIGSDKKSNVIVGFITKGRTFDDYSPTMRWDILLPLFAKEFNIPSGILTDGHELRIIQFTGSGYTLRHSWPNFEEIITNEELMSFYTLYSQILSVEDSTLFPKIRRRRRSQAPKRNQSKTGIYALDYHLHDKPGKTVDLFYSLREKIFSLSDSIIETPTKLYLSYAKRRKICEIHIQTNQLKIWIPLTVDEIDDPHSLGRDVRDIGHYGTGATEIILSGLEKLDWVSDLIHQSYTKLPF